MSEGSSVDRAPGAPKEGFELFKAHAKVLVYWSPSLNEDEVNLQEDLEPGKAVRVITATRKGSGGNRQTLPEIDRLEPIDQDEWAETFTFDPPAGAKTFVAYRKDGTRFWLGHY